MLKALMAKCIHVSVVSTLLQSPVYIVDIPPCVPFVFDTQTAVVIFVISAKRALQAARLAPMRHPALFQPFWPKT